MRTEDEIRFRLDALESLKSNNVGGFLDPIKLNTAITELKWALGDIDYYV